MDTAVPVFETPTLRIPRLGFGCSQLGDCAGIVAHALKVGYRHLDTAWKYQTEQGVGDGIRMSGVPRAEIFVTTKVSHEYLRAGDFTRMVDESLANLRLDYVDLLMVHWPSPDKVPLAETMAALAQAKRQGKARHVGVANFNIALLEEAMRLCAEPIESLQAEYHPYLDQTRLLAAVRRLGLPLTAYCPLGRGRLLQDPVVADIARAHGKTAAQVVLRWLLQQPNVLAIPRSANPQRHIENMQVFDFGLDDEEMRRIHALARSDGRIADPAGRAPAWD